LNVTGDFFIATARMQAVAVGNDCTEDMSARLAGIETYLVTDYVIGDAASSGADHISDALGFERWVLANY
jgi:hypothetical protein